MRQIEKDKLTAFFALTDGSGVTNLKKAGGSGDDISLCPGVITDDGGRLIGLGIHILNDSVYPIEKFELFLRDKGLCGHLDISGCRDMVFLDVYRNEITSADVRDMPSMRILGLQNNLISQLDVGELFACQGIDVGKNRLKSLDVSKNSQLVELYIHFNRFESIDLSHNPKLKYFWCCHNNVTQLDVTANPLLRHLDCTDNPLKSVKAMAPRHDEPLPLWLEAEDGGCVGLKFCPVYTPQWKETGSWQQTYFAYPDEGRVFDGWYENGSKVSSDPEWVDSYGSSHRLTAKFTAK